MTAIDLLGRLRTLGVHVWADGGQLRCRAPQGTLTASLKEELQQRKGELLAFLRDACDTDGVPHIPRVARGDEGLPLSFGQRRLWFLDRMQPGNPAYNIFLPLALSGPLDVPALHRSLSSVARRHEALRTFFPATGDTAVQQARPVSTVDLPMDDLSTRPAEQRQDALLNLARDEARRAFDLAEGPLHRCRLVRLDSTEHVLCWTLHHSIGDGWSVGLLIRDLATYYNGACAGAPVDLPDLPIQYADYAVWQQTWLTGPRLESLLAYWQRHLPRGGPLDLPTDRPRSLAPASEGARHRFTFERPLREQLSAFSRSHDVTPFMTLLAALFVLLARRCDCDEVVVGSPIAGRTHPQTHGLVGFFVNTLAFTGDLSGNPRFVDLLQQVKDTALGGYQHQELPFERLVEATRQARDLRRNPIFDVLFAYQNLPAPDVAFSGLEVRAIEVENTLAKFDLGWDLVETQGTIAGRIQYRTDLYDAKTVARIASEYRTLVAAVIADPNQRVRDVPLLDAAERDVVVALANGPIDAAGTSPRAPGACSIHAAFDEQAARTPNALALVAGDDHLTYAQLRRRSNALARRLREAGVGPGARVALWTDRFADTIVGIFGIWKAGGVYVPVDAQWPQARIDLLLADAAPVAIVAPPAVVASGAFAERPRLAIVAVDGSMDEDAPPDATSSESAAYIIYTSGSTGRPNGVIVTHGSAVNLIAALRLAVYDSLRPGSLRVGVNGPWIFDTTIKQVLQIAAGHELHVLPDACRSDPQRFLDEVRDRQLDVVDSTPSQVRLLVAAGLLEDSSLASLVLLIGGEAIDPALWTKLSSAGRTCFNLYGPTECTVDATVARIAASGDGPTIGRPLLNVRTYVLDRRQQFCPVGVAGELWIAGSGVARGYLNEPTLTAARFVPDPFGPPGARMYRTGDRVRARATGALEYLGRVDDELKIRGFRIEPQEIEATLMRHPGVGEAAVVGYARSAEDVRLVAYVTAPAGARPSAHDLRRFLREHLPAHLVPSAYVVLEALPLTSNGKLDRRALPAPDLSRDATVRAVTPRDAIEWQLAGLWADVLGLETVGVTDDFFELGGHSLLAMLMLRRVKDLFGCDIPIATLLRGATVEQLAAAIRGRSGEDADSPLVPIRTTGTRPPFFCVHPVGGHVLCYLDLAAALGADYPFYGLQAPARRTGGHDLRLEALADRYLTAIKTVQPEGPYQLGGWSLGGVIAFEMGRQLLAAGEDVSCLALIDSHAAHLSGSGTASEEMLLGRFVEDLLGRESAAFRDLATAARPDAAAALFDALHARATAAGLLPHGTDVAELRALFDLFRANLRAESRYRPAPAPLGVLLIRAEKSVLHGTGGTLGWDRLALAGVDCRVLPGDHYSLMRKPDVAAVAAELAAHMAAGAAVPKAFALFEKRA